MADTNWNFLNYEGLEYYDSKSEVRTNEKIAVETERAKTEEEKLSESINNEVDRATSAENTLTTDLNGEISRAKSAEQTLTTDLNSEISRAKSAEETNANSISEEITRATNAENTLTTNLSSHISDKSNPHGVTKAQIGLGDVDNTSDANKPISTATQAALDAKAPLESPILTGTPEAPTADVGTNTTQIATTEFVQIAVSNGIAASDAMVIKGTIGENGTITTLPTTYKIGWTYRVVTDGTYAGQVCEIGDLIIALVERSGSENADSDWCIAQTNINGAITSIKSGDAYISISQSGSTVTITHKDITRTDTTSSVSPAHGGTFTVVKSITSDEKGHITGVDTETVTLPIGNDTDDEGNIIIEDTKVTQTATNSDENYPLLLAPNGQTETTTTTSYFNSSATLNPSTNTIAANISGNAETATTATKIGTDTVGSATQPVYIDDGVPTKCSYTLEKSVPSDAVFTDTTYTINYDEDKSELQLKSEGNVVSTVTIVGGGNGGGSTFKVADVSGATISSYKTTASLKWTDPNNAMIDDILLAEWAGTLVVRKEGSAPSDKSDGVVVVDNKIKDAYSSTAFEDNGLEYGKTYYYRFFPYTTDGVYTSGTSVSIVPEKIQITTIPSQSGTVVYNGNLQTAVFNNYDEESLTGSGNTGSNAGTYTATFVPKYDYCWSDGSVDAKEVEWVIDKANGVVELSETSVTLDKTTTSTTVTVSNASGEVQVSSNNTSVLTTSISDNVITLTSTGQNGNVIVTVTVSETDNYKSASKTISVKCDFLKIVTWADGTYEEISAMLDAHYTGTIDISDYWSVGDVRTIPLSAMSATGVGESQSAQNADLVSPVNGNSKSAVSLQLKNSLATVGYMYSAYNSPSYSLWDGSPRRTWCNSVFKNALPAELVNLIKTVTKKTWRYAHSDYSSYRTQQTTEDDCFLISEFEVFGTQGLSTSYGTVGEDGTQYEYYKTTSNRIKYLGVSGTSANYWWLRSSFVNYNGYSYFHLVSTSGSVGNLGANITNGVAPGFCI